MEALKSQSHEPATPRRAMGKGILADSKSVAMTGMITALPRKEMNFRSVGRCVISCAIVAAVAAAIGSALVRNVNPRATPAAISQMVFPIL